MFSVKIANEKMRHFIPDIQCSKATKYFEAKSQVNMKENPQRIQFKTLAEIIWAIIVGVCKKAVPVMRKLYLD